MSAGKRLAKRSIVGTRVCAPQRETGHYYPGVIIGSKNPDELNFNNCNTGITPNTKYTVRFETGENREFPEGELVGPGFGNVSSLKLRSGQKVFVTNNGREVSGNVVYHRPQIDEVLINIPPSPGNNEFPFDVTKKLDEVRLLESRKSARLQEQDFDFARLADVADRKRSQQTASIDVPRNNNMSRKRRPSSGSLFQPVNNMQGGGDGEMDECAAALVLMSLSGSPRSPHWGGGDNVGIISSSWSSSSSGASSWLSANQSVIGSLGAVSSPGELIHNSHSPTPSSSDEGLESDIGDWEEPRRKRTRQIYKCTFPGCGIIKDRCFDIEQHVRFAHLGGKQGTDDREEEFYYTEIEVADLPSSPAPFGTSPNGMVAFSPTLSHMDMVRPPSEDPEYKMNQQLLQLHQRKSPNVNTHLLNPKKRASPKSSPVRRPRGDTKKCRKVYGMERRDMWCTQCKWKKACTRFGD